MLGDKRSEQSRQDKIRAQEARRKAFLSAIMDTKQGREWMFQLLAECHLYATSFSKSALEMAMNEGERNIGLKLTAQIVGLAPDNYVKMLRENGEIDERSTERDASPDRGHPSVYTDDGDTGEPADAGITEGV